MQRLIPLRFSVVVVAVVALNAAARGEAGKDDLSAFVFQGVEYFHRWSENEQHEFTPAKQEDLEHWSDMITINGYPDVEDGDELAEAANVVVGNYERAGAKILRTTSVPRTAARPAEHFVSAFFTRADFAEAAFARFKMVGGKGHSFVYSYRCYGAKADNEMKTWLAANGAAVAKALMEWDATLPR
jgi:hypothetical protein